MDHKPIDKISLTEVEYLTQSHDERSAAERAWIELITAPVHRRHRHDIEFDKELHSMERGERDIELED